MTIIAISRAIVETTKKYCEQALPTPKVCPGAIVVVELVTHCAEWRRQDSSRKKRALGSVQATQISDFRAVSGEQLVQRVVKCEAQVRQVG